MKIALVIVVCLALLVAVGLAYIRLAPSDPTRWHVDPLTADSPGEGGFLLRPDGGDARPDVHDTTPQALLRAFDRTARARPRTRVLAGSVAEGRITYVARSRLMGFPDYVTVQAVPADGGAALAILARSRFGRSDLGVNRARTERWLDMLRDGLSAGQPA